VCLAPQFQENHIFTNSLAFNLLLGCHWPPSKDDLKLAFQFCEEMGLKPLLEKMSSGSLFQPVGEMGWKLSHGEKSRVFIIRALLQGADLLIFDQSLAALDPHTLVRSLACIEQHSRSFLLCAHP
jgi:ATP-binding cassette subfamily B protein